jgi:dCTP deaminase
MINWFEYRRKSQFTWIRPSGVLSYQSIRRVKPLYPLVERTNHKSGTTFGLGPASYDVRIRDNLVVEPNKFYLASTLEYMIFPNDICGTVQDKSTWARKGLVLQNTHIDPGFIGGLTLEITHHGLDCIVLEAGTPIAQIKFEWLDEITLLPYKGKYQFQKAEAQEPIFEKLKN